MSVMMSVLVFLLSAGVLSCVALIIRALAQPSAPSGSIPAYRARPLLDNEENALYADLGVVCEKMELLVFAKVPLGGILALESRASDVWADILKKEAVDFVLCDKQTRKPLLALFFESGGATLEPRRSVVIRALDATGLPYLHLRNYNLAGLEKAINEKIKRRSHSRSAAEAQPEPALAK